LSENAGVRVCGSRPVLAFRADLDRSGAWYRDVLGWAALV
jgi:hypothetical protein